MINIIKFKLKLDELKDKIITDYNNGDLHYRRYRKLINAIKRYVSIRYKNMKVSYFIPNNAPNRDELEIFEILRSAYSKNPNFNSNTDKKLSMRTLLQDVLKGGLYHVNFEKVSISTEKIQYIVSRVEKDLIQFYAFEEYSALYRKLVQYNPFMMFRYSKVKYINYYARIEKGFEKWLNKLPPSSYDPKFNDYAPKFNDPKIYQIQCEILLHQWGGRSPVTGDLYDPQDLIDRHHYETSNPYNKRDCRIRALVPLSKRDHGIIKADLDLWENRLTEAKEVIDSGRPFIPYWWSKANQKAYISYLLKHGYL